MDDTVTLNIKSIQETFDRITQSLFKAAGRVPSCSMQWDWLQTANGKHSIRYHVWIDGYGHQCGDSADAALAAMEAHVARHLAL